MMVEHCPRLCEFVRNVLGEKIQRGTGLRACPTPLKGGIQMYEVIMRNKGAFLALFLLILVSLAVMAHVLSYLPWVSWWSFDQFIAIGIGIWGTGFALGWMIRMLRYAR